MKTAMLSFGTVRAKFLTLYKKKKLKDLQKRNGKILKVFNDCDFLPAWRFFKTLETGDLRYLLDCDVLPEYDTEILVPVWDNLQAQYDKIKGDNYFSSYYNDINADLDDWCDLIILKACHGLLNIGRPEALPILSNDFGIEAKDITANLIYIVGQKIRSIEMRIQIEMVDKPKPKQGNQFIKSVVQLSSILNRTIDHKTITVSEYIYLDKEAQEVIQAKKKSNGAGY